MTRTTRLCLLNAMACSLLVAGCGSPESTACSVSEDSETVTITCDDNTEATLKKDGSEGSCSVSDNGDGTKTISCDDGTIVTVSDGEDGANGEDGSSCSVADNGDGTKTISCNDGTTAAVSDGQDGVNNNSCSVADNGDGTKTISCDDGTTATVSDGQDGTDGSSCSVSDNGDGTRTISCDDGTSVNIPDQAPTVTVVEAAGPATCPSGTRIVNFETTNRRYIIQATLTLYMGTGFYASDALPTTAPGSSSYNNDSFNITSGSYVFDNNMTTYVATSPYRALGTSGEFTWTHSPTSTDSSSDPNIGFYDLGSASLTVSSFSITNVTGRIGIFNDNGPFDLYQVALSGEVTEADSAQLGLPTIVTNGELSTDLTRYTPSVLCGNAACMADARILCATAQ